MALLSITGAPASLRYQLPVFRFGIIWPTFKEDHRKPLNEHDGRSHMVDNRHLFARWSQGVAFFAPDPTSHAHIFRQIHGRFTSENHIEQERCGRISIAYQTLCRVLPFVRIGTKHLRDVFSFQLPDRRHALFSFAQ